MLPNKQNTTLFSPVLVSLVFFIVFTVVFTFSDMFFEINFKIFIKKIKIIYGLPENRKKNSACTFSAAYSVNRNFFGGFSV